MTALNTPILKPSHLLAILSFLLLISPQIALGDMIIKKNGQKLEGTIIGKTSTHVVLRTPYQIELNIKLAEIESIQQDVQMSREEQDAEVALSEQRYEAAIALLESALKNASDATERERLLGKVKDIRDNITKRDMSRIETSFRDFDDFLKAGNFDRANQILDRISDTYRSYPAAIGAVARKRALIFLERAKNALNSVNPDLAEQYLRQSLELDESLLDAHLLAVERIYNTQDPDDDERLLYHLREAISLGEAELDQRKILSLKYQYANILFERNNYEEALPFYAEIKEQALTRYPRSLDREIECLAILAEQNLQGGNIEEAIEDYSEVITENPNHPKIEVLRRRLGELYLASIPPEPGKALEQFQAIQSSSESNDIFYLIAKCYIAQDLLEEATALPGKGDHA